MKPFPVVASERRAHDRHPLRTSATLQFASGPPQAARTLDIGRGGMGIVAGLNPPLGTELEVRLRLPVRPKGNAELVARARVVNSVLAGSEDGFRLGLQFSAMDAEAKSVLARFLP